MTVRDLLVVVQIAICAVLVTSSMVAVRGLVRSMHGNFGFEPRNAMLVDTVLDMAGYRGDAVPPMQKRMIDAVATIPGVTAVGLADWVPLSNGDVKNAPVFTEQTTDLRPANAVATPADVQDLSRLLPRRGHSVAVWQAVHLARRQGRAASGGGQPGVCAQNLRLRNRCGGPILQDAGWDAYRGRGRRRRPKIREPHRRPKAGDVLADPAIAVSETWLVVRSKGDPQQLAPAIKSKLQEMDAGLACLIRSWNQAMNLPLFPSRVATVSLGVLGMMGAMLSITGIFGMAAYSVSKRMRELGIRMALGAQRKEVLQAALGRALKVLALGSAAGLLLGILASRVLAFIVYQATPRDPLVLAGVVSAMSLLGLLATWIPAQRALSIDPLTLLREE